MALRACPPGSAAGSDVGVGPREVHAEPVTARVRSSTNTLQPASTACLGPERCEWRALMQAITPSPTTQHIWVDALSPLSLRSHGRSIPFPSLAGEGYEIPLPVSSLSGRGRGEGQAELGRALAVPDCHTLIGKPLSVTRLDLLRPHQGRGDPPPHSLPHSFSTPAPHGIGTLDCDDRTRQPS
jgi:hypothetical protein